MLRHRGGGTGVPGGLKLKLFDGVPYAAESVELGVSDPVHPCGLLSTFLPRAGSYWLVVEVSCVGRKGERE